MKHKKIISLLSIMVLLLGLLTACGKTENVANDTSKTEVTEKIIFTDQRDKEITLEEPAKKVVVLTPSDCETLFALGAEDTIVGRGKYCDYPAEVESIPAIQTGEDTNIEEIISFEPEIVITSTTNQTEDQIKALEEAGIAVVVTDASSIEEVYTVINLLGQAVGKESEATQLAQEMKNAFSEYVELTKDQTDKTIYFEVAPLEHGLWTAGNNTFMTEISQMIGLKNIFEDIDGWAQVSQEQVIERNPDYIVTITMYDGQGDRPEEEIIARSGWENISAVKDKKVFMANSDELSRPGPRLMNAIKSLYDFVYDDTVN